MTQGRDLDASAFGTPAPAHPVPNRLRRWTLALALLLLVGGAGATVFFLWLSRTALEPPHLARKVPADPRLLYEGPFGNVHPDVAYVGDNACTSCHADIAASYRKHPMGRSLQPIAAVIDSEVYDKAHNNPFQALGVGFLVDHQGTQVWHRQTFADVPGQGAIRSDLSVAYVLGSGTHGRSYLSNRDGFLFQTPISWFTQKQFWNLSPGFDGELLAGRPVDVSCLFCHANRANHHEGTFNRYEEPVFTGHAIGCERCHGPGGRHIETTRKLDIVNPCAKLGEKPMLTAQLRDAVCEQCHLEGQERIRRRGRGLYDFRPGLALTDFFTVFVSAAEPNGERRAVSHVEQMHESRCYQRTKDADKLGCVSCHDPHVFVPPAEQASYYRKRCLKCHESDHPCSLPEAERRAQQADDSCIACHMHRFSATDIAHTAATDHRVPRRPAPEPKAGPPPRLDAPHLVPFHDQRAPGSESELARDLGLALVRSAWHQKDSRQWNHAEAVALLETALRNDPQDLPAWQAKGEGLMLSGRLADALAAFQAALRLAPENESALVSAATVAQKMDRLEDSLDYWRRSIAVNAWMPMYRSNYARLLQHAQRWPEAGEQCRVWMRLEPNSVEARKLWITCLLREGNKDEARAEFARITSLKPSNLGELRIWFRRQMR